MNPLEAIEERYGFIYPALYKQLYAEGLLDIGQTGLEWLTREFPRLRLRPPLLYGHDFELMQVGDVAEEIAEFLNPDSYREIRPELQFIPFAMSGAGDPYCFHLNAATDAGVPVVYMYHDANKATFKARKLQDFIFRGLLEAVAEVDLASLIMVGDFAENCQAVLDTHGLFITSRQREVGADIYRRGLTTQVCRLPPVLCHCAQAPATRHAGRLSRHPGPERPGLDCPPHPRILGRARLGTAQRPEDGPQEAAAGQALS